MTTAPRTVAAVGQTDTSDAAVRYDQIVRLSCDHAEIGGLVMRCLHRCGIELAIGLRARPPHRRALAPVEHAKLDAGGIRDAAHQPVERVDLPDQMALAEPTDRRIARHRPDGRETMGYQRRPRTDPRRGGRGFAAGVATADHDDVEGFLPGDHSELLSRDAKTRKQEVVFWKGRFT